MRKMFQLALAVFLAMMLAACGTKTAPSAPTSAPVAPKPGATLSGAVEISGKASAATITLKVSADGTALTSVAVTVQNLKCDGFSAGSMTKEVQGTFPVTGGTLTASVSGIGEIKGRFTSPTEASGTANLTLAIPMSAPCALGEYKWSAKAQ